jgi:hypothetical protein
MRGEAGEADSLLGVGVTGLSLILHEPTMTVDDLRKYIFFIPFDNSKILALAE